jgi:hypothetical protein
LTQEDIEKVSPREIHVKSLFGRHRLEEVDLVLKEWLGVGDVRMLFQEGEGKREEGEEAKKEEGEAKSGERREAGGREKGGGGLSWADEEELEEDEEAVINEQMSRMVDEDFEGFDDNYGIESFSPSLPSSLLPPLLTLLPLSPPSSPASSPPPPSSLPSFPNTTQSKNSKTSL